MAEGAPPPPQPPLLETLENNNNSHQNNNNHINNTAANSSSTNNNNNNNHHSKLCGMLGINMPCEAAGHDFSTVRKELEYANSIASHYGAAVAVAAAAGLDKSAAAAATVPLELQQQQQQQQRGAGGFKIEDRERSDNCSRSNSPVVLDELNRCAATTKVAAALRSREKMSPLSLPTPGGSPSSAAAAAAAAAAASAQMHLNGTMQDMLNLQKLQSLAQLTSLPGLGLPTGGIPSALLANNSPLNLSLGAQSHSPTAVMSALAAAATPQPLPAAAAAQMPQLILASGQIVQGIQGAQLLIPTSQGIATQTILTIPVGQQVISSASSGDNLLQCLNFNTVAAAAAAASSSGPSSFGDLVGGQQHQPLQQQQHPHPALNHHHLPGLNHLNHHHLNHLNQQSPNAAITSQQLLTNPLALAAAAAASSNHLNHLNHLNQQQQNHLQHQHHHQQQQQQQQQQQAKQQLQQHFADKVKNLSTHEKTPSERSTPEMRIKLESPKVASPSSSRSHQPNQQLKRTNSMSPAGIVPCAGGSNGSSTGGSNASSNGSGGASNSAGGGTSNVGLIQVRNLTSPQHQMQLQQQQQQLSPVDGAISRITTSNGEITVTKSQPPQTPPLLPSCSSSSSSSSSSSTSSCSVQKPHPSSMHFSPSISPQHPLHHPSHLHNLSLHPSSSRDQQQNQQQQQQQLMVPSSSSSLTSTTVTASGSSGGGPDQQNKPSSSVTCSPSTSGTTPGIISLTMDDVEQKISPHALHPLPSTSSSCSSVGSLKRHRSLTPPPRKHSPGGSSVHQLSHEEDLDDDGERDGDRDRDCDEDGQSTANELEDSPNELTINQTNCNVVDGIDLDDIKEFAKAFKLRRLSLGLTQTQVGQALSVTEGPAYSQSAICSALAAQMYCAAQLSSQQQQMFEKLDITPKSAQKIKPVLERWMKEAEESHSSRFKSGQNHLTDFIGVEPSKKRKRRTSFTPQALELLNGHFERNTHPSGTEITGLAHQLGYEREVIRIWFCNKRQALKNTVRMMSKNFKMESS